MGSVCEALCVPEYLGTTSKVISIGSVQGWRSNSAHRTQAMGGRRAYRAMLGQHALQDRKRALR